MSDATTFSGISKVTVIIDGMETNFELATGGETILNTAIDAGVDAPYSCKGGVCTTCRAKLVEGSVHMKANFALTDKEVKNGYILACQSQPTAERVVISWDV